MPYFDTIDRVIKDSGSGSSKGSEGSDERRGDNSLSYDEWVAKQKANGWPEWFIRWAYPRESYEGTNEFQGFTNFASFAGSLFGGASLLQYLPSIISAAKGSDNDNLLKALYGDAYTPGNNSGILSGLKDLFSGMSNQLGGALSGLGSGLLGIGSELGSSILNFKNQEKLIDKQNEYNTPANQMKRFADAGLNPNLIYGLGTNGNQPASGSVAPVDFATAQRENRLAKMQIETQTAMARADIADKMANVHLKESQANNVDAQTAYQGLVNNNYVRDLDSQIQQREAQTDNLRTQKRELLANAKTAEERAKIAPRLAEIDKAIAENEKTISDKKAEYAEATAFTEMLGNIFGVNFGLGASFNVGRGTNTTISKRVN